MIKISIKNGSVRGHISGRANEVLYEYELITRRLVVSGITPDEITRAAARGIVTGEKEVEENDHM